MYTVGQMLANIDHEIPFLLRRLVSFQLKDLVAHPVPALPQQCLRLYILKLLQERVFRRVQLGRVYLGSIVSTPYNIIQVIRTWHTSQICQP